MALLPHGKARALACSLSALLRIRHGSRPDAAGTGSDRQGAGRQWRRTGRGDPDASPQGCSAGGSPQRPAPGPRGLHLHGAAECRPPNFIASGPHQNGEARNHGFLAPTGYHTGDLPNLFVGSDGIAQMDAFLPGAGLTPGQKGQLWGKGVSIVVKSAADDYLSDPTGNSGARLACGVFVAPATLADADLARREAELAQREAELARKEAELQARAASTPQPAATPEPALPSAPAETAAGLPAAPQPAAVPAGATVPPTGAQIIKPDAGNAVPSTLSSPQAPSIKRGPLQVPEDSDAPHSGNDGQP
ncbi:superoxide dismutase family protein [Hankyongella ginsenosidimutans]|uniref:superoxide dismutase family protein n=1 Tax=Hankyongella ginsenosidimutans TaxID=1763828 RepID=UPI001FE5BC04|nr:superoxide dismutase family protein [Hankyongella ginsenosidimutans]